MTHEAVSSQRSEVSDAIANVITDLGIDSEEFSKLDLSQKIALLKQTAPELGQVHIKASTAIHAPLVDNKSLVLIKPEIFPQDEKLLDDICNRGFEIDGDPELVYPTSDQWLELYGYMILDYPTILQNYIVHRAVGLKILRLNEMDHERITYLDSITGKAYDEDPSTIRGSLTRRIMLDLGFRGMTGYASAFDPLGVIAGSPRTDYGMHCYNGIHTPKNSAEAASNLRTFDATK